MSDLSLKHCLEVLDQEILVGSESIAGVERKKFSFHVLANEYRVYVKGEMIDSGHAVEELLDVYNSK